MKMSMLYVMACCGIAAMLSSCSKEQGPGLSNGVNTPASNHTDPIQQLRDFQKHLTLSNAQSDTKSEETLSLEQALWDVENHFNLTYTDAEQYHSDLCEHEFHLDLPLSGSNEVSMNDAVGLYTQAVEQARQTLLSEKSAQREFISLNVKETTTSEGIVQVLFSGKTGTRCNYNPPQYHVAGPFDTDDNWMFAAPWGKCDDPDIPSGADEQLQEKLFDTLIGIVECAPGTRNIYLNRFTVIFDGSNYPGVYYNDDPEQLCIPYYDMNLLYKGELNLISKRIPEQYQLQGYSPVSISIYGVHTDDQHAVTHRNEIEYGIRYPIYLDEFGEVEDLITY